MIKIWNRINNLNPLCLISRSNLQRRSINPM